MKQAVPRETTAGETDSPTSYLASYVHIFFSVVLGTSILVFKDTLFSLDFGNPSFWALVSVYVAAATSWMGWSKNAIDYPHSPNRCGYLRSLVDSMIVATYAALLTIGDRVYQSFSQSRNPSNALLIYLIGFALVFALYSLTGLIRRFEHRRKDAADIRLILIHCLAMISLIVVYAITYYLLGNTVLRRVFWWMLVILPIFVTLSFRWFRNWRGMEWRETQTQDIGKPESPDD